MINKQIAYLLSYRLLLAIISRNYQYPDQYWQGPQVAHRLHYGYGYLTWQWTISQPLRNPIYPYILSLSYYIVDLFNLQYCNVSVYIYSYAPQFIVQIILTVITDYYMLKILRYIYGNVCKISIFIVFGNWYYASTLIRTYFNSFQTCITVIAFYYWISNSQLGINNYKDFINRLLVTISYISRPTSLIIWAILWPYQLFQIISIYGIFTMKTFNFISKNIINIILMIMSSFIVGTIFNGKLMLTQLNFIKYNFIEKWSQFYGRQSILFYFILTLPFTLNFTLIFLCLSIILLININTKSKLAIQQKQNNDKQIKIKDIKCIIILSIIYLLISSASTHKQHRFILPIIPFLLIISVYCLQISQIKLFDFILPKKIIKFIILLIALTNIFIFIGFNCYGKNDGISVWKHIDNQMNIKKMKNQQTAIIVLGESHFMPGYSSLHRNITYRIPDSSAIKMSINQNQNKLLFEDPQKLYQILTQNGKLKPNFIIAQGKYLKFTSSILQKYGYILQKTWRHCTILEEYFIQYDFIQLYKRIQ